MSYVVSKKSKGFTLIELLVVISIIGLLSSVVLAALQGARVRGINSRIILEVGQLRNAFEQGRTGNIYSDFSNMNYFASNIESVVDFSNFPMSSSVSNIVNDILKQNNLNLLSNYAGGRWSGGVDRCGIGRAYLAATNNNFNGITNNGLTIYTNFPTDCVTLPTKYAIYAAYAPKVGLSGYYCLDSSGTSISKNAGGIPSSITQNDGVCH